MLVQCAHMQSIKTATYSLQITESKYHTLLFLRYVHFALQHLIVLQVIVLLERKSPDSFISKLIVCIDILGVSSMTNCEFKRLRIMLKFKHPVSTSD